jgi:hypothetical protein
MEFETKFSVMVLIIFIKFLFGESAVACNSFLAPYSETLAHLLQLFCTTVLLLLPVILFFLSSLVSWLNKYEIEVENLK